MHVWAAARGVSAPAAPGGAAPPPAPSGGARSVPPPSRPPPHAHTAAGGGRAHFSSFSLHRFNFSSSSLLFLLLHFFKIKFYFIFIPVIICRGSPAGSRRKTWIASQRVPAAPGEGRQQQLMQSEGWGRGSPRTLCLRVAAAQRGLCPRRLRNPPPSPAERVRSSLCCPMQTPKMRAGSRAGLGHPAGRTGRGDGGHAACPQG